MYKDKDFWDESSLHLNVETIHRVKISNRKYSRSVLNRLIYYLEVAFRMLLFVMRKRRGYDLVFVTSPPIFVGIVGVVAKWRFKSKLLLDIRDLWPESLKGVGVFNYKPIIFLMKKKLKGIYIKKIQFNSCE